jgi:hypothetical protein
VIDLREAPTLPTRVLINTTDRLIARVVRPSYSATWGDTMKCVPAEARTTHIRQGDTWWVILAWIVTDGGRLGFRVTA